MRTVNDRCPNCDGEIEAIAGNRDAVACVECGLVNPETNQSEPLNEGSSGSTSGDVDKYGTDEVNEGWKEQVGITDSSDENLVEILSLVDEYIEAMNLSQSVRLRTAEILMSVWEHGLFEGRQKEVVTAGGVYAAGRELQEPRPLTNLSNAADVSESAVNNAYRLLIAELELPIPVSGPQAYVTYVGQELSLPSEVITEAETALESSLGDGGNPAGIAAAVLYLLVDDCESEVTLNEAGAAAGVSKETVWRNTQTLRDSGREFS